MINKNQTIELVNTFHHSTTRIRALFPAESVSEYLHQLSYINDTGWRSAWSDAERKPLERSAHRQLLKIQRDLCGISDCMCVPRFVEDYN